MQLFLCASPLGINKPDEIYEPEYRAAKDLGYSVGLLDFESLEDGNLENALRRIKHDGSPVELSIYRGWMLTPTTYESLFKGLSTRNFRLINTPEQYKHCHYLPEWYSELREHTPESIWLNQSECELDDISLIMDRIERFNGSPCILKDFVKSEKHKWKEACFIANSGNRSEVERVVTRFLELRESRLEGGLVFRKYEQFRHLTNHSKSGMPLTREYRLYVLDGKIIHSSDYWAEGNYENLAPPLEHFSTLAQIPESRFFTMDVAETIDGRWLVVELGDAQVSELSDTADPEEFYKSIQQALSEPRSINN